MALRNKDEHSYRTLAMEELAERIQEGSDKALAMPRDMSPEGIHKLLMAALLLVDLKLAFRWLESLDQELCPEVPDSVEGAVTALKADSSFQGMTSYLDELFAKTGIKPNESTEEPRENTK